MGLMTWNEWQGDPICYMYSWFSIKCLEESLTFFVSCIWKNRWTICWENPVSSLASYVYVLSTGKSCDASFSYFFLNRSDHLNNGKRLTESIRSGWKGSLAGWGKQCTHAVCLQGKQWRNLHDHLLTYHVAVSENVIFVSAYMQQSEQNRKR